MVLTARNRQTLSKQYVKWFQVCQTRLRRSTFAKPWRGGLTALELTNESQGWHLHSHSLVDADYIDGPTLARRWANIVQQDIAIIKVKAVTGPTYLAECTKYTVKGNDAARWNGNDLVSYIEAFDGIRTFGTWGNLFKDRAKRAKAKRDLAPPPWECPKCGSHKCRILNNLEEEYLQTTGKYL